MTTARLSAAILLGLVGFVLFLPLNAQERRTQAWTLEEALTQLRLHPNDPYLQYVALQLARGDNRLPEAVAVIEPPERGWRRGRREDVDLFSIFTGALAVQESLQLDTMRGEAPRRRNQLPPPGFKPDLNKPPRDDPPVAAKVSISSLTGPTIKSHPWKEMLAGKKPDVSPLARYVPEDFYFVEFRSLNKLVEAMDISDLWGTHLFNQAYQEARTQQAGERMKKQLAVETNPLLQTFYDLVVEEVAVAGSDLFAREGSDVTLLFQFKQPEVFKARMDGFLTNVQKARPDAGRAEGEYLGIPFVHVSTPDREVNVYSAYPAPNLHVRSNSRTAFQRVIEAFKGRRGDGTAVQRLGDSLEFAYIRTLMPRGAPEEDGFVYLSDPFIRRMVGPQLKLTERRRVQCYNHLRMIGHGALLHRTQHGRLAESLADLVKGNSVPGLFGDGKLACPDGGKYTLSKDGLTGTCSHHGHAHFLTPCCEIPVSEVTGEEAQEYKAFLEEYNRYWRTFFDPIGIRIQITPQRYRVETIVLPLIDNSIYTGLATALGGKPEQLDALPVPKGNIFSVALRLNKEKLLKMSGLPVAEAPAKPGEAAPADHRHESARNLQQIAIGMHDYHSTYDRLPAAAILSKDGKPLLSWRVALLPYMEGDDLYKQFKLDEPWDSEHNKKLIGRMPAIYRFPGDKPGTTKTPYVVPVGEKTVFPGTKPTTLGQLAALDGSSNTIMVVEADEKHSVVWTKPEDWKFDAKQPMTGLVGRHKGAFPVAMADGSARIFRDSINPKTLAGLFTRDGGEVDAIQPADEERLALNQRSGFDLIPGLNDAELQKLGLPQFLAKGIGNQVGLHVYDGSPLFDFNLPSFLGEMMGSFGTTNLLDGETLAISALVSSLNAPVYVSIPVQDQEIVDRFLDGLDQVLARLARQPVGGGFLELQSDFYRLEQAGGRVVRTIGISFGPLKFRFFYARIGAGLYIASKAFILEHLASATDNKDRSAKDPAAHAMIRIRAENWNRVLPEYRLGWAENNRRACLNNLGPLASVARGTSGTDFQKQAERLHDVHFFCPEGGQYRMGADGKTCDCSVHGSAANPRQPVAPIAKGELGRLLDRFSGLTATLTFLEDGLHAVVVIERR